ncbi:MAG: DNA polymerase III subunit delta [Solirubrobacterales bacterium]
MAELKAAYLFTGDDEVKIDQARKRLAARAAADGATLETLHGDNCTPDSFAAALLSPSLLPGTRIVLADGVEGWKAADVDPAVKALEALAKGGLGAVAVLICRKKPLKAIEAAVAAAGGQLREFKPPSSKELPGWLVGQARQLGVELDPAAAQLMIDTVGEPGRGVSAARRWSAKRRLLSEIEKLATSVGPGGTITPEVAAALVSGESSAEIFALTDAAVAGNHAAAVRIAEDLMTAGEPPPRIVAMLARSFGQAQLAAALIEAGKADQVATELKIQPWLAGKLAIQARARGGAALRCAVIEIARLDSAVKGGSALDARTELLRSLGRIAG